MTCTDGIAGTRSVRRYAHVVAGTAERRWLVRFLGRRRFVLSTLGALATVRLPSGSWWWALLGGAVLNPILPGVRRV